MKNIFKKIVCIICISIMLINIFNITTIAASNVIQVKWDGSNRQAFVMTVGSTKSDSSIQAFCIGWTFTFTSSDKSMSTKVYVELANVDKGGTGRTYIMPISPDYAEGNDIKGGLSIYENATYKYTLNEIMKNGGNVVANARIQKFKYENGVYTGLNVYANSVEELYSNFSEFSSTFLTTTSNDYFNWEAPLDPEVIEEELPQTPTVTLTAPKNGDTYYVGASIPFTGTGTNCDHIAGLINGNSVSVQKGNTYTSSYTASQVGKVTFQLIGRNTVNENDPGSKTASSPVVTVNVVEKPSSVYTVVIHFVTKQADGTPKRIAPDQTLYIQQQDGKEVVLAVDGKLLKADDQVIFTSPDIDGYKFNYSEITEEDRPISD